MDYTPAPLRAAGDLAAAPPLDLTYSTLRSVSPIHVEYLRNMGVRASMSISLLRDDKLWGLIACHHYSGPHAPPYATRAAAEFLGSTLSLRLVDRAEEDEVLRALRVRSTLAWLTAATLDEDRPLADTLLGSPSLLDLLPADGVAVHLQGHRGAAGAALPAALADRIAAWAAARGRDVVATDALPQTAPELGAPVELACGVLVLPLPEGQYILWFRGEAVQHIDWGGDPHNKALAPARATRCASARGNPSSGGRRSCAAGRSRGGGGKWPRWASCATTCSRPCTRAPAASCARPRRSSAAC